MTGQPQLSPQGGMFQGIGQPGAPAASADGPELVAAVAAGSPRSPTVRPTTAIGGTQFGSQGATINGEVSFGGEGSLGDEDLCGGFDMRG